MQHARVVARVIAVMGLEPTRAMGQIDDEMCPSTGRPSSNELWFKFETCRAGPHPAFIFSWLLCVEVLCEAALARPLPFEPSSC